MKRFISERNCALLTEAALLYTDMERDRVLYVLYMASHYTFDYIFHERISQTTLPTWLFVVDPAQVQGELEETLT